MDIVHKVHIIHNTIQIALLANKKSKTIMRQTSEMNQLFTGSLNM